MEERMELILEEVADNEGARMVELCMGHSYTALEGLFYDLRFDDEVESMMSVIERITLHASKEVVFKVKPVVEEEIEEEEEN